MGPAIAALGQQGQGARVVDVRVGKHDRVQIIDGDVLGDGAVLCDGFLAAALEQAAVKQDGGLRGSHHVLGPGHLPGGPDALDLDQSPLL